MSRFVTSPPLSNMRPIGSPAERTRATYDALIARGYAEYKAIQSKNADGYYGWEEAAPFDKIIVTCGIDHIPPPLLQQLKPDGIMVIPVGPPGAQHILKVVKKTGADGTTTVARSGLPACRDVAASKASTSSFTACSITATNSASLERW